MKPAPFDYKLVASAAEAVEALAEHGDDGKVLAGGQSLVPMLNMRLARPAVLVDINGASDLEYLREDGGRLVVGALCRQHALERWAATRAPLLAEALRSIGHLAIRTRGTVAGSIAHGDPASELPALLLACDGEAKVLGTRGERLIPAAKLYLAPLTTALAPDELVAEVRLTPPPAASGWGFAEVARRHGDFALVGAIAVLRCASDGTVADARLTFFGVGGTPVRSAPGETALIGRDPTATRLAEAARVLAERTLQAALGRVPRAALVEGRGQP